MSYIFTSESVSEGHPDKVADQISDAILDSIIAEDPTAKVAAETLVTTGLAILSGEVKTEAYVDVQKIARQIINHIGYTKAEYMFDGDSCGILSAIHEQSPDINQGVVRDSIEEQGAGDQGMMFGFATNETESYMPLPLALSHDLLKELARIRKETDLMPYLRPDSKSQVSIRYGDNGKPEHIDTIVISTQHDDFAEEKFMREKITEDLKTILLPDLFTKQPQKIHDLYTEKTRLLVNPTGKFVIGGPHGDTGLTGRKIIVDTYGGKGAHGGGAFSGKDPSKVDRSAAYAARHIAKNLVAAGIADEVLVQLAYAIGVAEPVSVFVNTYGTSKVGHDDEVIAKKTAQLFDLRPGAIVERLKLQNPIYLPTASYGHMGRTPEVVTRTISNREYEVELFTWEKLDFVNEIKAALS